MPFPSDRPDLDPGQGDSSQEEDSNVPRQGEDERGDAPQTIRSRPAGTDVVAAATRSPQAENVYDYRLPLPPTTSATNSSRINLPSSSFWSSDPSSQPTSFLEGLEMFALREHQGGARPPLHLNQFNLEPTPIRPRPTDHHDHIIHAVAQQEGVGAMQNFRSPGATSEEGGFYNSLFERQDIQQPNLFRSRAEDIRIQLPFEARPLLAGINISKDCENDDLVEGIVRQPWHQNETTTPPASLPKFSTTTKTAKKGSFTGKMQGSQQEQWRKYFEELIRFRDNTGHCLVPHSNSKNPKLSQWVKRQRYQYKLKRLGKKSALSDEREQLLTEAGFVWNSQKIGWRERLERLKAYRASHGNCNVPHNYADKALAIWVKSQRRQYKLWKTKKKSTLDVQRVTELDSLGFDWNPRKLGGFDSEVSGESSQSDKEEVEEEDV